VAQVSIDSEVLSQAGAIQAPHNRACPCAVSSLPEAASPALHSRSPRHEARNRRGFAARTGTEGKVRTLLPEDQQLLSDQQLRDASAEQQLQDLIARLDLLLRSKGQPGLTLHPPEDEPDTPEPADPSDPRGDPGTIGTE